LTPEGLFRAILGRGHIDASSHISSVRLASGIGVALLLLCSPNDYAQPAAKEWCKRQRELPNSARRALLRPLRAKSGSTCMRFLVRMPKARALALPLERRDLCRILYSLFACGRGPLRGPCQPFFVRPAAAVQSEASQPICGDGKIAAAKAFADQNLYDALIDAHCSMRQLSSPQQNQRGMTMFFDTFGKVL